MEGLICIRQPIALHPLQLAQIPCVSEVGLTTHQFRQVGAGESTQRSRVALAWTVAAEQILLLLQQIILEVDLLNLLVELLMQLIVEDLFEITFKL